MRDEFTIRRAATLLAKKWGPEGAAGRKAQRERERIEERANESELRLVPNCGSSLHA